MAEKKNQRHPKPYLFLFVLNSHLCVQRDMRGQMFLSGFRKILLCLTHLNLFPELTGMNIDVSIRLNALVNFLYGELTANVVLDWCYP